MDWLSRKRAVPRDPARPAGARGAPRAEFLFSITEYKPQISYGTTSRAPATKLIPLTTTPRRRATCATPPNLLVLDLKSGDVSGDLARLRFASGLRPIIALVNQENEGLRGLFAGADDFVIKPVSSIHLIARVQALLRRTKYGVLDPIIPPDVGPVLRVNDVELNLETHRVSRGGHDVRWGRPNTAFSRSSWAAGAKFFRASTCLRASSATSQTPSFARSMSMSAGFVANSIAMAPPTRCTSCAGWGTP